MFSGHAFTILCTGIWMIQSATGSTISDVSSIDVTVGENALIPWNYSLTGGQTVDEIIWTKLPSTPVLTVRTGSPTPIYGTGYSTRASTTAGTAYLQLTNIVSNDEATYRCQIVLNDLSEVEDEAQLIVTEPASFVWMTVQGLYVVNGTDGWQFKAGENVTLRCNHTGGKPPPTYTFRTPDGTIVNPTTSNSLVINSFQATHAGEYSCIASNVAGDRTSDLTRLVIAVGLSGFPSTLVGGVIGGLLALLLVVIVCWRLQARRKSKPWIEFSHSSGREVEVQWTAKYEGSYKVGYRCKGREVKKWTYGPEVTTNDHPKYKYTVTFPKDGEYEVCVQGTITCLCCLCCQCKVTSDCKDVTVPIEDTAVVRFGGPGDNGTSGEQDTPFSPPHGTNAPKTDVPLVVMITEGQSHQVKLEPIVINKQNPAEKKEKKKKKRKKVNKVNASDDDTKPED